MTSALLEVCMSLLQSLGLDSTIFIQFLIACFSFLALAYMVFIPFQKAYLSRLNNTIGSQSEAEETLRKIKIVQESYQSRMKELNDKISEIFSKEKKIANLDYQAKLETVKLEISKLQLQTEESIQAIRTEYEQKKGGVVSDLSKNIFEQLVTKG